MGDERSRSIPLYLSWVGTLCGALVLLPADVLPVRLGFVRPDTLFVCLTEVEIAFILFAWPLFLGAEGPPVGRRLLDAGVLLVAALPLGLIAANMSNVEARAFLGSQAQVGAIGAFSAAVFELGRGRGWPVGPWYVLAALVLGVGVPFLGYLGWAIFRTDLSWAAAASPFWAAAGAGGGASWVQAGVCSVLAAALLAFGIRRRGEAAP